MKLKEIGEFALIERLTKKIRIDRSVIRGIGDDTAVLEYGRDKFMLFTTDLLVEDVHFKTRHATLEQLGHKALACCISDIAAMGGIPKYAAVSIALPKNLPLSFVEGIYAGIRKIADRFDVNIVGGDTSSSRKIFIDVSMVGFVKKRHLTTRDGAKNKDLIFVTGELGGSIKGKHLRFIPRIKESQYLVNNFKINSMIDLSDGLASDLGHITKQSKVGAVIYENLIPVSPNADSIENALCDGEDFELLFTLSQKEAKRLLSKIDYNKFQISLIGYITDKQSGIRLVNANGKHTILGPKGFRHF